MHDLILVCMENYFHCQMLEVPLGRLNNEMYPFWLFIVTCVIWKIVRFTERKLGWNERNNALHIRLMLLYLKISFLWMNLVRRIWQTKWISKMRFFLNVHLTCQQILILMWSAKVISANSKTIFYITLHLYP